MTVVSRREIDHGDPRPDALFRDLFGLHMRDEKARRKSIAPCPICGRRGYHVKHCERVAMIGAHTQPIDELALRWMYVARIVWSNAGLTRASSSSSSRVLTKGGRVIGT